MPRISSSSGNAVTFASKEQLVRFPDRIAVIGGGRWARELTSVLCAIVPPTVRISVHSPRNSETVAAWARTRGLAGRIDVSCEWPQQPFSGSNAVIVANATRDHAKAVEAALAASAYVLVEKPISITGAVAQRLADLARSRGTRLAAAHVFLFSGYLARFARLVAESTGILSARVCWEDPRGETRYGEQKRFDPAMPVFADCLPHVLSMLGALTPSKPVKCVDLQFLRGGAHLDLEIEMSDFPCKVQLVRNGGVRRRSIDVATSEETLRLDFSAEPATIASAAQTVSADPDWRAGRGPLARMLAAFLHWAAGGSFDDRLDVEIGLQANRIIDDVAGMYNSALLTWLTSRRIPWEDADEDVRYALTEMLQSRGLLESAEIEQQIERVRRRYAADPDPSWLRTLVETSERSAFLDSVVM